MGRGVRALVCGVIGSALLLACSPSAAPAKPSEAPAAPRATTPAAGAGAAAGASSAAPAGAAASAAGASPAAPTTASRPALMTSPPVHLIVHVLPIASWGPYFVAQERGYFREVGLDVEFFPTSNVNEALPALTQGQIQIGACSSSIGCLNAFNRRTDLQIVADLQSAGRTEKSTGNSALVVRKEVWDAGTIREPRDLIGRSIYNIAGPGSGHHVVTARWLKTLGLDPLSMEWPRLPFPELLAAMSNGAVDVGVQTEPLVHAGVVRGVHQIMATQEEMYPTTQILYVTYWSGIERMGPMVGERFMVAYLRAARDVLNAFEYGVDQEAIIDVLVRETTIKDAAVYREIKYSWVDPNGVLSRSSLQADADLLRDLGVAQQPIDLSQAFDDRYRQFAVDYLGEYKAPR